MLRENGYCPWKHEYTTFRNCFSVFCFIDLIAGRLPACLVDVKVPQLFPAPPPLSSFLCAPLFGLWLALNIEKRYRFYFPVCPV